MAIPEPTLAKLREAARLKGKAGSDARQILESCGYSLDAKGEGTCKRSNTRAAERSLSAVLASNGTTTATDAARSPTEIATSPAERIARRTDEPGMRGKSSRPTRRDLIEPLLPVSWFEGLCRKEEKRK